jgi:4-phospho-D-threonate 3-dehydrogenase / 4-phospho-D-erythronate 3-dehydrogenase
MKIKIAITIGDAAGIGPEIAIKVALDENVIGLCDVVIIGPEDLVRISAKKFAPGVELVKFTKQESVKPRIFYDDFDKLTYTGDVYAGKSTAEAGLAAYEGVRQTVLAVLAGKYDAIVTAPVSKESVNMAGITFQGHTELVAELCEVDNFCMMQSDEGLRVAFASCHVPLMEVRDCLSKAGIVRTIKLLDEAARADGVAKPLIAIAGVNPHAGEGGYMGREEIDMVIPAMAEAAADGILLEGPFPADTLFIESVRQRFDGIVAMYHDQGHIPFKMLAFDKGVNSTLGLPIIRTSVDHGTAFNIAWQGIADTGSLLQAVKVAVKRVKLQRN